VAPTNKMATTVFCHLRWYQYLLWPMD